MDYLDTKICPDLSELIYDFVLPDYREPYNAVIEKVKWVGRLVNIMDEIDADTSITNNGINGSNLNNVINYQSNARSGFMSARDYLDSLSEDDDDDEDELD